MAYFNVPFLISLTFENYCFFDEYFYEYDVIYYPKNYYVVQLKTYTV